MNIRLAENADMEQLYALGQGVSEFEVSEETVEFWPKAILAEALGSPDVAVVVAEDGGKLVGFALANINTTLQKAIVENLFVASTSRGQGLGGELIRHLCAVVTTAYACNYVISLVPPEAEAALQTYQQAGFTKGHTFVWLDKVYVDDFRR